MTKNANQTLSSPSRQLRLSLTNDERMLLFSLLGDLHILLSQTEFVLGFSDLEGRQRVVSGLFQRIAGQNDILLNDQEEYEVYIALGGLPYFSDNPEMLEHDKALAASIRAKLLAAESAPAEPAPAEDFECPRFEIEPHGDGWFVIGYWADGEEAFREYFPDYDDALGEGEAFLSRPGKWRSDSVESSPAEPAPAEPVFAFSPRESAIISRELGGNIRFEQGVFHSEVLGAFVHILQGNTDAPALQASAGDVLEAARMLRRDYNLLRDSYDALCDDYEQALSLIDRLKDRLKEVLSSSSSASGVKKGRKARRAATARTGRWYEALEVSA